MRWCAMDQHTCVYVGNRRPCASPSGRRVTAIRTAKAVRAVVIVVAESAKISAMG